MTPHHLPLLEGNIPRHLRRLAIPLVWGLVSISGVAVVDTWFIGRLGIQYLAAFSFTIPIVMFFSGVIFGLAVGTTSALSRVYGSGDIEKMRQMATDALTLAVLIMSSVAAIGFFTIDRTFRLMGAREEVLPLIDHFMSIWYCGLPFLAIQIIGNSCSRALGDTRFQSFIMILSAAITVTLDPFLIYGLAGLPRLELAGAALALSGSYAICAAVSMYALGYKRKIFSPVFVHGNIFDSWKKILHVSIPSAIGNQIGPLSFAVITWIATSFGHEAVAALGVANRIEAIVTIAFYSAGAGLSIFVGQNFGAGNFGRVQDGMRMTCAYVLAVGAVAALILAAFSQEVSRLFTDDAKVIAYATEYLHIVPISYGAFGVMIICSSVFNAVGKPFPSMLIGFLKAFALYVPLAYILQFHYGFTGIVIALALTNFVMSILSYIWNRKAIS